LKIYCDGSGGYRPKFGYYVEDNEKVRIEYRTKFMTGNEAEYRAVLLALKYVMKEGNDKEIEILSDSKVVINQLNHLWHIKSGKLRSLAVEVWSIIETLKSRGYSILLTWVPRSENKMGKALG